MMWLGRKDNTQAGGLGVVVLQWYIDAGWHRSAVPAHDAAGQSTNRDVRCYRCRPFHVDERIVRLFVDDLNHRWSVSSHQPGRVRVLIERDPDHSYQLIERELHTVGSLSMHTRGYHALIDEIKR